MIKDFFSHLFFLASLVVPSQGLVLPSCVPPTPPQPNIGMESKFGTLSISPESSNVKKGGWNFFSQDSTNITFSVIPNVSVRSIFVGGFDLEGAQPTEKIINSGPKPKEVGLGSLGYQDKSIAGKDHTFPEDMKPRSISGVGWHNLFDKYQKPVLLPARVSYWATIKVWPTIPYVSGGSEVFSASSLWRNVRYAIENSEHEVGWGNHFFYVGQPQVPGAAIVNPHAEDIITLLPRGVFEVSTKTGDQAGRVRISIESSNGEIVGDSEKEVKPGDVTTWQIRPNGGVDLTGFGASFSDPIGSRVRFKVTITNTCGVSSVERSVHIKFDTSQLTKDDVSYDSNPANLMGWKGKELSSGNPLTLRFRIGINGYNGNFPSIPFVVRATYKDRGEEEVVRLLFSLDEKSTTKKSGTITIPKLLSTGYGYVTLWGEKLNDQDVKRGILLKIISPQIIGFESSVEVPLRISKKAQVKDIIIKADRNLVGIKEGDKISFKAFLRYADLTQQELKDGVVWAVTKGVNGAMGGINEKGVFEGKLDDVAAEYGESEGQISATYKDVSGSIFIVKSALFKVEAVLEDAGGTEG